MLNGNREPSRSDAKPSPKPPGPAKRSIIPKVAGKALSSVIYAQGIIALLEQRGSRALADIVDKQTRSRMMAGIRGRDTRPEIRLRSALHRRGFRFRLHDRNLPGRPDIVMSRHRVVIQVHGCFWHRHEGCRYATMPKTNSKFWKEKFRTNIARDLRTEKALLEKGWRVATIWECGLRPGRFDRSMEELIIWIGTEQQTFESCPQIG